MPKIPVFTAQGQGAVLRLPSANANALGGQAGSALVGFGQQLMRIDAALKDQRDKLDLSSLDADYRLGLDKAHQDALKEPDIAQQEKVFARSADALYDTLSGRSLSSAVRSTFQAHAQQLDTHALIGLRHEGRQQETERQIVSTQQKAESYIDAISTLDQQGFNANKEAITIESNLIDGLVAGLERNGHLSPIRAQVMREGLSDRYWSEFARQHPDEMSAVREGGPTAPQPVPLDWQKLDHYEQIAANASAARHGQDKALREQAAEALKKDFLTGIYGPGGGVPGQDISRQIVAAQGQLDSKEYEHFLEENAKVEVARQTMSSASVKRTSSFSKVSLLDRALTAKHDDSIDLQDLRATVMSQVTEAKRLHPDDAGEILHAIVSAEDARQSTDRPLLRAKTSAMRSLDVLIPMRSDPEDAFVLRNAQDTMHQQFLAELDRMKDPTPNRVQDLADSIRVRGEQRILSAQELTAEQIDVELQNMEAQWRGLGPDLQNDSHELDPVKRADLERRYPLLRGIFSLHDKRRARWDQLVKVGQSNAANAEPRTKKTKP